MNKIGRHHCSKCLQETEHNILFKKETTESEVKMNDDPEFWAYYGYYYSLYECMGCHNIVMKKQYRTNTIEFETYTNEQFNKEFVAWYPALVSRRFPKWHAELPEKERELFFEIYHAYHSDSKSLSIMGLRTILDMFIVRTIGDKGSFKDKLKELAKLGYLSAKQIESIEPIIDAGSAAAHRGYQPTSEDLTLALDLVETLLHQDILARGVSELKKRIPTR